MPSCGGARQNCQAAPGEAGGAIGSAVWRCTSFTQTPALRCPPAARMLLGAADKLLPRERLPLQNSSGGLRDAKAQRCYLSRYNPIDSSTCAQPEPRWSSFSS
ncbi:hypothetical protein N8I77_004690 [Diaporthe amygdali]|uniref:Uncharacterized protein n=1 Tax=Phomopsis amygdali TaxID=1214568 RepID=A0AAD9SMT6_PHOAM|nr:hypothetical protein N8I77_004690 [Diaporthe amygdali]KAK2611342.1 hypothetical protein N8I77_004690 [Diaporthe amygdali]